MELEKEYRDSDYNEENEDIDVDATTSGSRRILSWDFPYNL